MESGGNAVNWSEVTASSLPRTIYGQPTLIVQWNEDLAALFLNNRVIYFSFKLDKEKSSLYFLDAS